MEENCCLRKGVFTPFEREFVLTSGLPNKVIADELNRSVKSIIKFKYRNTENGRKCLAATKRRRRRKSATYS